MMHNKRIDAISDIEEIAETLICISEQMAHAHQCERDNRLASVIANLGSRLEKLVQSDQLLPPPQT